jgi:hypothetical protein
VAHHKYLLIQISCRIKPDRSGPAPAGKLLYKISSRPISVDSFNSTDLLPDHVTYGSVFGRYLSPESGGYPCFTTPSIGHFSKLAFSCVLNGGNSADRFEVSRFNRILWGFGCGMRRFPEQVHHFVEVAR